VIETKGSENATGILLNIMDTLEKTVAGHFMFSSDCADDHRVTAPTVPTAEGHPIHLREDWWFVRER
jgi:hypothetical protein